MIKSDKIEQGFDLQDDQAEIMRIDSNPRDAAFTYLRQLRQTTKEYKILASQLEKLSHQYEELKSSNDDLKLESRETAEELMNMESEINELRE